MQIRSKYAFEKLQHELNIMENGRDPDRPDDG